MHPENELLSDLVVHSKYARYIPELSRREDWFELVSRNKAMHLKKYPDITQEITEAYNNVYARKILPSMRSLQFGGVAITRNNSRIYNCAYLPVDSIDAFSETMFLLLSGCGVGYSVQFRHTDKLPAVQGPRKETRRYLIGDSVEGWADAVKVVIESHFLGKHDVEMDYADIRAKGAPLRTSGGKAPGPQPLRLAIKHLDAVLRDARGRRLRPIEVHDIMCHIADAVLSGGIRRSAMISLFSLDDNEMMNAKTGSWWELNPQRGRANNSVCLLRGKIEKDVFMKVWDRIQASNAGEPGVYWTNNLDWGTNPCCEIALKPFQFCNLVEINASTITSEEDYYDRCRSAATIATLQSGYTDFHYLRPIWRETTEADALIGVGTTGIAAGTIDPNWLDKGANHVVETNKKFADLIGVRPASRCTTVKPSGTASIVVGSSSGIHAYHAPFYLRRMRFSKEEAIWKYLERAVPELCEDDFFDPENTGILTVPQRSPVGAAVRTEKVMDLLARVSAYNNHWVRSGHVSGDNQNNVSVTVSIKDGEWDLVGRWMWNNRTDYNGISVLNFDGGSYKQAPFEDCSKKEYDRLLQHVTQIDLKLVTEDDDNTVREQEAACAGGACSI